MRILKDNNYSFTRSQKSAILEVGVNNPSTEEVTMLATISGGEGGLSGDSELVIASAGKGVYQLKYSPVAVGRTRGCLIFQNPQVGTSGDLYAIAN